jgi:hypothetical protein
LRSSLFISDSELQVTATYGWRAGPGFNRLSVNKMALGIAPSGRSQKDVCPIRNWHGSSLLLQSNSHQTKKPERFVLCRRLLREASSSSVYEGLPTWNLTAANRANEAGGACSEVFDPLSSRSRRRDAGIGIRESREGGDLRSFARRMFRVCALHPRDASPCPRNAHARKQESKDARSGPRGDPPTSEWALNQVVHRWLSPYLSSSYSRASATRTESQLPLSAIQSKNVWMRRAAVPYNEMN